MRDELAELRADHDRLRSDALALNYDWRFLRLMRALEAKFDPNQPRDAIGRWTDEGSSPTHDDSQSSGDVGDVFSIFADLDSVPFGQRLEQLAGSQSDSDPAAPQPAGATVTYSNAVTGDARIDETTERLTYTLKNVMNVFDFIPDATPRVYGTAVHSAFGAAVKAQSLEGVKVEFSYKNNEEVVYGTDGSVRADVALRTITGETLAIYDLKTGGAVVSSSRANELRSHFSASQYVPVIELQVVRGSRIKHATLSSHFRAYPEANSWLSPLW